MPDLTCLYRLEEVLSFSVNGYDGFSLQQIEKEDG